MINKIFSLKNKISLVTGSSSPLGNVICNTLAEAGSDIILLDKDVKKKEFQILFNSIKKRYREQNFTSLSCDLSNSKERLKLSKKLKRIKKIDIFVNNAAFTDNKVKGYNAKFKDQNLLQWKHSFEVNLTAIFDLTKILLPKIKKSKSASIINIASIYGVFGPDWSIYKGTNMNNPAAYASAKAGLIQFTKWLSKTLGPNIRANAISPGGIFRNQPKKFVKAYTKKTALNRMAKESDFVGIIALLSSDASSYITGQNIIVDGGWGT